MWMCKCNYFNMYLTHSLSISPESCPDATQRGWKYWNWRHSEGVFRKVFWTGVIFEAVVLNQGFISKLFNCRTSISLSCRTLGKKTGIASTTLHESWYVGLSACRNSSVWVYVSRAASTIGFMWKYRLVHIRSVTKHCLIVTSTLCVHNRCWTCNTCHVIYIFFYRFAFPNQPVENNNNGRHVNSFLLSDLIQK